MGPGDTEILICGGRDIPYREAASPASAVPSKPKEKVVAIETLEQVIAKWRASTRRSDGQPGEGKGPIANAVRQCADDLEALIRQETKQ